MREIITGDGKRMPLKEWQQFRGIKADTLSANFKVAEFDCKGEIVIAEPLIDFLQVIRYQWKKPLTISSGYRSQTYQEELRQRGFKAATNSPHVKGMAVDIDTSTKDETILLANFILAAAKRLSMPIRIGFNDYLKGGQTFIHVDICPKYYAKGMPFNEDKHPTSWEIPYLTW